MKKNPVSLILLAAILVSVLTAAGFVRFTSASQEVKRSDIFAGDPALEDLANYKQWIRVNEKPLPVSLSLNNLRLVPGNELFTAV